MARTPNDSVSLSEIAKLYYEDGLTQEEIARRVGLSRPLISRKLVEARKLGVVKIFINSEVDHIVEMERRIRSAFSLKGLKIEPVPGDDPKLGARLAAKCAASYFAGFIGEGDRVATAWGRALNTVADCFPQLDCSVDLVMQCVGNIDNINSSIGMDGMITKLSRRLNAREAFTFSWPIVVSSPIIANTILFDERVRALLESAKSCNKLMASLSFADRKDCLYNLGYLTSRDIDGLEAAGAVGNICHRFYDREGRSVAPEVDSRIIGISLEDIRRMDCVMACVAGPDKSLPLYYALKNQFIDVLVLDSFNAEALVRRMDEEAAR